ncbi:hypothetical protein U6A24_13810 [Aquimarina gracilis]|uniref:Dihydrolipoamide dehydrogenase n=1 Tax=Aquimarina gracilis TaxID=874422 RepID=A0ABU5ZXF7_9FLAO|nr:hypothetical protein [Aquimarina gracilis]MEB3346549.1 hypothetical protein [Aquimarina gracilis]
MKKIFLLLCFTTILFASCSNDDDTDFDTIGSTFEITTTFNAANNFAIEAIVPNNIDVFDSDVALVYVLDPIRSAAEQADVWEPLPRTLFFDGGGFAQYQFNFIFDAQLNIASIEIFLESDDLNALDSDITDNQDFRIVIVPSSFAENTNVDLKDFKAVQSALKLEF